MKSQFVRILGAIVAGSMLAVLAASPAAASTTGTYTTYDVAAGLQALTDQLQGAVNAGDVATVGTVADQLQPVLSQLADSVNEALTARSSLDLAALADQRTVALQRQLSGLPADLPDPLAIVSGLLQTLLAALQGLIASLLGTIPVPVPVPPVPLPVPIPPVPAPIP